MVYHYKTSTMIFTPSKCGSSSLRAIAYSDHREFLVCTGPAPWNDRDLTFHTNSEKVSWVHTWKIKRRILLVRNPTDRIVSLWKHIYYLHDQPKFTDWLNKIEPKGHEQPMRLYCRDATDFIHLDTMANDLYRVLGTRYEIPHVNASSIATPELSEKDITRLKMLFATDYELMDEIKNRDLN